MPELYRRAGRWYEQHGWGEDACEYALRSGDLPHAARLLEELVPSLVEQGKLVLLRRWLDQLPQELIAASVSLSLALIWTQPLRTSEPPDPERVTKHLTALLEAHAQDNPESQAALQRELALHQAARALAQGNIPQALARAAEVTHSLTGAGDGLESFHPVAAAGAPWGSLSRAWGSAGLGADVAERLSCWRNTPQSVGPLIPRRSVRGAGPITRAGTAL